MKNLGQVTENQDIATKQDIPTKTSELTNDSGFITSAPVTSVVGRTGHVTADQIITGIQTSDSGFACGSGANATSGGAIGLGAIASTGGAVGFGASANTGFAGGYNA